MASSTANPIPVIDFRRQSMVLNWHAADGTWTPCDAPPAQMHGIALIRPSQPNVCVYGHGGRLHLQIGATQYSLAASSPRLKCVRNFASLGFRRRFSIESASGGVLFTHRYWTGQGDDFFRWLAARAADPDWRAATGRRWSEGIDGKILRAA